MSQAQFSFAVEAADFGACLAQRLAELVRCRRLSSPASKLWVYGVDNFLVRAVDSHTQVGGSGTGRGEGALCVGGRWGEGGG